MMRTQMSSSSSANVYTGFNLLWDVFFITFSTTWESVVDRGCFFFQLNGPAHRGGGKTHVAMVKKRRGLFSWPPILEIIWALPVDCKEVYKKVNLHLRWFIPDKQEFLCITLWRKRQHIGIKHITELRLLQLALNTPKVSLLLNIICSRLSVLWADNILHRNWSRSYNYTPE